MCLKNTFNNMGRFYHAMNLRLHLIWAHRVCDLLLQLALFDYLFILDLKINSFNIFDIFLSSSTYSFYKLLLTFTCPVVRV